MPEESTAIRLKKIMDIRGYKQVDIIRLCEPYCLKFGVKLAKSTLSQYISGLHLPDQDKLLILGMGLRVNPGWLMGFDIPMEMPITKDDVVQWIRKDATVEDVEDIFEETMKRFKTDRGNREK